MAEAHRHKVIKIHSGPLCLCAFEPYKAMQLCNDLKKQSQFQNGQNDVKSIITMVYGDYDGQGQRKNKANFLGRGVINRAIVVDSLRLQIHR